MGVILCNNDDCVFNNMQKCQTAMLKVSENGNCHSFKLGESLVKTNCKIGDNDSEFGEMETPVKSSGSSVIDCYAECIYNKNTRCTSGDVDFYDGLFYTKCKTRAKG